MHHSVHVFFHMPTLLNRDAPGARSGGVRRVRFGTAYRIRTDDLRLERAVSWASRRMRRWNLGPLGHPDPRASLATPDKERQGAPQPALAGYRRCDSMKVRTVSATCS